MSNKSLEIVNNWVNNQRMSFEKKDMLMRLIKEAIKEAEEDVRREMQRQIDEVQFEYDQKAKALTAPSNAFVAMLRVALTDHPDIIQDAAEDIITSIAEDVAEKEVESHVRAEHCEDCEYPY